MSLDSMLFIFSRLWPALLWYLSAMF